MRTDDVRSMLLSVIGDIAPDADLAPLDPDGDLRELLGLDSIDFLNIVAAVRDRTGVDIAERDYPTVATLNGFIAHVAGR